VNNCGELTAMTISAPTEENPLGSSENDGSSSSRLLIRWSWGLFWACTIVLVGAPLTRGSELVAGLSSFGEALGFSAFWFLLTFWMVRGKKGPVRVARRSLYASALYLLSTLNVVFFHVV
jgi:hypothetical protein